MAFYFSFLAFLFRHPFLHFDIVPSVVRWKNAYCLFFLVCKSRNSGELQAKHPVKLIFPLKNEISGEKISQGEEKNTPQKVVFDPKVAGSGEKGWFWGENDREGMK